MSYLTSQICITYAHSPPDVLEHVWNDECCKFVKPSGKCGQPATAKTCVVSVNIGAQNFSPEVKEGGTLTYGMIGVGSFGSVQACGKDIDFEQGTSKTSATSGTGGDLSGEFVRRQHEAEQKLLKEEQAKKFMIILL